MRKGKILAVLTSGVIMGTCLITGSLAWFTDAKEVTNVFTVGNISMQLHETCQRDKCNHTDNHYTVGNEKRLTIGQNYKIIPGDTVEKDPQITIEKNSENCYVFAYVENELSAAIPGGITVVSTLGWTDVTPTGQGLKGNVYQYTGNGVELGTGKVLNQDTPQHLDKLFTELQVDGTKVTSENISLLKDKKIIVRAYAHQAENTTLDAAKTAAITHFKAAANS